MNITIINGTEVKGCTFAMKEIFVSAIGSGHQITEFYLPKDMPHFCCGCKVCFFKDENKCPHAEQTMPIWEAILNADLLVFAAPVYGLSIPASLKALLDHYCVHWMVHRPNPAMFSKTAVIITNCIGAGLMAKLSQRDMKNALSWMGVSKIKRVGIGLLEGVIWDELSEKRQKKIESKIKRIAGKHKSIKPAGKSLKTRFKFFVCKAMHQAVLKKENPPSADNQHWIENGWIKKKK